MKVFKIVIPAFCLLTLALACQAPGTTSTGSQADNLYAHGVGGEK